MESPNSTGNMIIGTYAAIGIGPGKPRIRVSQPHWMAATRTPYAAPIEIRLTMAAFTARVTERKIATRSSRDTPTTTAISNGRRRPTWSAKSTVPATGPPTWTPAGSTSARRCRTTVAVGAAWALVVGYATTSATAPSELTWAGETDAIPGVLRTVTATASADAGGATMNSGAS